MLFSYECQKCGKRFDGDYSIGKAPRIASCPSCTSDSKRVYDGISISVKVVGGTSRSRTFGEEMKSRNLAAGERMKGRKAPVKLAALDYGNGDVRAVEKKKK